MIGAMLAALAIPRIINAVSRRLKGAEEMRDGIFVLVSRWGVGPAMVAIVFVCSVSASANPLDPALFPSLGGSPFAAAGTYVINTSSNPPLLTSSGYC